MQHSPYQPPDWTQLNQKPVSRQAGNVPPPAQLEPEYQVPAPPQVHPQGGPGTQMPPAGGYPRQDWAAPSGG